MMTKQPITPVGCTGDFSGPVVEALRVPHDLSIDDRAVAKGELVRSLEHLREAAAGLPLERLVAGKET